jgi:glycosyltransferase involved in cell wall biosynthesis
VKIYLANVDLDLFPPPAHAVLTRKGHLVAGNLSHRSGPTLDEFRPDLVVYVPTRRCDGIRLTAEVVERTPTVTWILYPDQLLGWNELANRHGEGLRGEDLDLFRLCDLNLANSTYTKSLFAACCEDLFFDVCHLGIDSVGIARAAGRQQLRKSVLWQHRWSSDKNLANALEIVASLAVRRPDVTFYVGRHEDWQPCYVPQSLRDHYGRFAAASQSLPNVVLVPPFARRLEYWRFLRSIDVAFSCSYHETFGVAMLEQACAGAACVVPRTAVYPEVHRGALVVPMEKVIVAVDSLLGDELLWRHASKRARLNAHRYDVRMTAARLAELAARALDVSKKNVTTRPRPRHSPPGLRR